MTAEVIGNCINCEDVKENFRKVKMELYKFFYSHQYDEKYYFRQCDMYIEYDEFGKKYSTYMFF